MTETQSRIDEARFSNPPEGACVNFRACGNVVVHNGMMCDSCLELVRARERDIAQDWRDLTIEEREQYEHYAEYRTERLS